MRDTIPVLVKKIRQHEHHCRVSVRTRDPYTDKVKTNEPYEDPTKARVYGRGLGKIILTVA